MASRFVRPETTILKISNGDTLTVKRRLTSGEQRASFARLYQPNPHGELKVNPLAVNMALITAYLVDWTLTDEDGTIVPIRGVSLDELATILDTLDVDSFREVHTAVEAHDMAMREEKKTIQVGPNGSGPISNSPLPPDGPLVPSVNLNQMSTPSS